MFRRCRPLLWLLLLVLAVLRFLDCGEKTTLSEDQIAGRSWVDRLVEDPKTEFSAMLLMHERGSDRIGGVMRGSLYRFEVQVVSWRLDGERLEFRFLQSDALAVYSARVWSCPVEAPEGLDLCLEMRNAQGTHRFYGSSKSEQDEQRLAPLRRAVVDQLDLTVD